MFYTLSLGLIPHKRLKKAKTNTTYADNARLELPYPAVSWRSKLWSSDGPEVVFPKKAPKTVALVKNVVWGLARHSWGCELSVELVAGMMNLPWILRKVLWICEF